MTCYVFALWMITDYSLICDSDLLWRYNKFLHDYAIVSTINLINYIWSNYREREKCTVEKNCVRKRGSQSQNAQWNKHLLSEAQRVPRSTLMHWAISGWSNFSEGKHGTKRASVLMINWYFAFTFGERYLWILLLDDELVSSARYFPSRKKNRVEKKTEEEEEIMKKICGEIRGQTDKKKIVQSYYLYPIIPIICVIIGAFQRDNISSFCIIESFLIFFITLRIKHII